MPTTLHTYDIGCEPSPSVPAETLIQDGWATYLLFFAASKSVNELRDTRSLLATSPFCVLGGPEHW